MTDMWRSNQDGHAANGKDVLVLDAAQRARTKTCANDDRRGGTRDDWRYDLTHMLQSYPLDDSLSCFKSVEEIL